MEMRNRFDDAPIRRLLAGSPAELTEAVGLIDCQLRQRMCGWLRKRCPTFNADEIANTWSETMLSVLQAIRAGRFDPARPLLPWLCQIIHARAVDHARRSRRRQAMLTALGETLRKCWGGVGRAADERREMVELVRSAIARLPAQQQRVLRVFVEHYPETGAMEVLREEVSRVSGRRETLASVKRALQEARVKLRSFLRRMGYAM